MAHQSGCSIAGAGRMRMRRTRAYTGREGSRYPIGMREFAQTPGRHNRDSMLVVPIRSIMPFWQARTSDGGRRTGRSQTGALSRTVSAQPPLHISARRSRMARPCRMIARHCCKDHHAPHRGSGRADVEGLRPCKMIGGGFARDERGLHVACPPGCAIGNVSAEPPLPPH